MAIILSKIAIVAGNASIADQVCAHFRAPGVYVVLMEQPMVRLVEYGVFTNDCIRICNAVRTHHPELLLLVGCKAEVIAELQQYLPPVPTVELNQFNEEQVATFPGFRDHAVEPSVTNAERAVGDVVVVEDGDSMSLVIARNLVAAHGGCVVVVPSVPDEQCAKAQDQLRIWSNESGTSKDDARRDLLEFLAAQCGGLTQRRLDSISFITKGIPYGLWPFGYPTTHFFSFPMLGVSVLSGMVKSINPKTRCPQAVLIDPGALETSELSELKLIFEDSGYVVRDATGVRATAMHARFLTEHTPSDFLFYSTHCGEVRGRRITEEFRTSDGVVHQITYDLVKSLALSPRPGIIEVQDLRRFISMDGVSWSDRDGKRKIGVADVLREFVELCRRRKGDPSEFKIINSIESEPVRSSDSLQMNDFTYSPMPRSVGGFLYPLVFNNACSSWRELAMRFGCNGASIYIGTSLDILNSVAISVVTRFAKDAANGRAIGHALHRSQKQFGEALGYSPYLMHGYIFTKIRRIQGGVRARSLVALRLLEAMEILTKEESSSETHRAEVEAAVSYLHRELDRVRE